MLRQIREENFKTKDELDKVNMENSTLITKCNLLEEKSADSKQLKQIENKNKADMEKLRSEKNKIALELNTANEEE